MSPADSGEYVCHVVLGSEHIETSVLVTIEPAESIPGEWLPVIQKVARGKRFSEYGILIYNYYWGQATIPALASGPCLGKLLCLNDPDLPSQYSWPCLSLGLLSAFSVLALLPACLTYCLSFCFWL